MKRSSLLFVAAALAALAPAASWATSCGVCPYPYAVWPDAGSPLPLNPVLIITVSPAGPDFGPHLIGPHGRVRLKRVEMAGLGPLLGAFAPGKSLEPDQRYELHFRRGPGLACNEASWMTGTVPDSLPPVWRAPPSVEYAGSSMGLISETADVFVRIPAFDDGGALAVLVALRADFSEIAKKAQIQGVVTGELSIGPYGRVEEVVIVEDLPMGLGQAAVAALGTWRFAPARDGAPLRKIPFQTHFMKIQLEYHPDWNP